MSRTPRAAMALASGEALAYSMKSEAASGMERNEVIRLVQVYFKVTRLL